MVTLATAIVTAYVVIALRLIVGVRRGEIRVSE